MLCPFCGGSLGVYGDEELKNLKPKCRKCGRGPKGKFDTYQKALTEWEDWAASNFRSDAFNHTLHIGDHVYFISKKPDTHVALGTIINLSEKQATIQPWNSKISKRGFVCVPYNWVVICNL